jgi:hypothetical protein
VGATATGGVAFEPLELIDRLAALADPRATDYSCAAGPTRLVTDWSLAEPSVNRYRALRRPAA